MRRALLAILSCAVVASGCGNARTKSPNIGRVPAPSGFRDQSFIKQGLFVRVPRNWRVVAGDEQYQVATVAVGDAQIGIWRYPRDEPLPETRAQLKAALTALIAQVRNRDASFKLASSRIVVKKGLVGVELLGSTTNQGQARLVRSLHAYAHKAEVVVDAFAPPKEFARIDEQTFAPVARSLKLGPPGLSPKPNLPGG